MNCNGNNERERAHSDEEQPTEGEEEKEEKKKKNIEINTTATATTKRVLLEPNKRESTFQGIGSARNSYRQLNQVNHHITHKESEEEGGEGNEEESRKTRKKKKKKPKSTSFKSTFIQITSASPQPIPKKQQQQQPSQQSHRWQSFTTTNLLPKAVTTTAQSDGEVLSIRHSASPIHRKKKKKKEKNHAEDKGEEEEEEGGRRKEEWVRPVWHKSTTATVTTPQQQIQRIGFVRENGMLEKKQQQQRNEREAKEEKEEQEEEDVKELKEVKGEEDEKQNKAEEERGTRQEEHKREDENGNEEARDKGGSEEASEKEGTKKRWSKERAATVGANNENELHLRIEEAHPRKAVSDILPFSPRTPPHHDNEEGREQADREAEGEEEEEENEDLKEITVLLRRRSAEERRRRIEEEVRKIKMELKQREKERRERKQFEREMEKRSSLARVDVRMMVGQHVEMIARSSERIDISVRRKKKEEAKQHEAEEEVKVEEEEEEDMSKQETKQEEAAEETTETETIEHNKEGEREEKDDDDEEDEQEEEEDERRQRAKTMVAKKERGTSSPLEAKLWRRSTARERKLERIDSFAHILHFLSTDRLPILCGDNESESERERAAEQAEAKAREEASASSASFSAQQQQKQQQKHKKKKAKARREKEELKDAEHDIAERSEEVTKETPAVCITKAEEAEQQEKKAERAGAEEEEDESETYSYSDSSNGNSTSSSRINDNTGGSSRFSSFSSYSFNNNSSLEEEEKEDDDELMVHEGVERLFEGFTLSSAELQRIQRKLHTKEGRRLFTSSLQVQRTKARKELRSECFYQMEALMEAALVAAEQAADYRTAKHVMHLSTTFYRTVGTGWSSDEMQEYLQSALCLSRRVTICRELIFWQEIYYDSIQEERLQLLETMNHKAWQEQTQAEREDLIAWERNFLFGQLGSYSTLMLNFGVPFKDVIGFVEHQCDVNELTSSHRLSLTDHLISSKTMLEKEKEEREKKLTKEAWLKQRKEEWAQKQAQRYRRTVETKVEDPSVMELAGRSSLLPMPSRATSSPGPLRRNQQLTKSAKIPSSSPSPASSKEHWKEKRALSKSPRKKSPPFIPRLAGKTSREKKRDRHSPLSLSTPDISPSSSCSSSHEDLLSSSSYSSSSSSSENERDSTVATMLDQQRMSVERKRCLISIIQNLERKRMLPHLFSFLYFGWMGGRLRASIILPIADKAGALLKIHNNDRHHRHFSASSSPSSSSLSRSKASWRERTFALKDNFLMYFEKDGQQVARIFKLNVKWAVRVRCGYVERKTHRFVEEEEEEGEGAAADHPQKETTEQQTKNSEDNDRRAEGEEEKEQRYCIQVWIDEDGQVPMILAAKTAKEQRKWYSALRKMTHWTLNPAIVIFADDDTESSSSSPSPSSSSVSFSFASRQQRKEEEDRKRFSGGDFVRTGTYSSHSMGRRQPQEEPKEENISLL
ncbi:hypothetical protein QOT17_020958 [Balamuthia mandrillaris]